VAMGRYPYTSFLGGLSDIDEYIIKQSLNEVGLVGVEDTYFNDHSDGEKQRVLIAKAIAQQTPIILLDEPTAHLDLPNRIEIMLLLRRLSVETGKCFIVSMHELELAMQVADCVWLMSEDGVESGIPEDLMMSGAFQRCFASKNYNFNNANGHFVINHSLRGKKIAVQGDEYRKTWLEVALRRAGYEVTDDSNLIVFAEQSHFIVDGFICKNIADVLNKLTNSAKKINCILR
jgi:iron complex transport system ATP-binding protein